MEPKNVDTLRNRVIWIKNITNILSGSASGVGLVISGYPFDSVKVRCQTSEHSVFKTIKNMVCEGDYSLGKKSMFSLMKPFYKGISSPLFAQVFISSCSFFVFSLLGRKLFNQSDVSKLSTKQTMLASALNGLFLSLVENPFEILKIKTQAGNCIGPLKAAKEIYASRGLKGFYQGITATMLRSCPAMSLYFGSYYSVRKLLLNRKQRICYQKGNIEEKDIKLSQIEILMCGSCAGLAYWMIFPFDSVKSIIQADHHDPNLREHKSYLSAVKTLYSRKGIRGFYCGYFPTVLSAIIAVAIQFQMYEFAQSTIKKIISKTYKDQKSDFVMEEMPKITNTNKLNL